MKVITIFTKFKHFIQCLQAFVIEHKIIWNSITLVVAFDLLHNDFKILITPFFHLSNKDFEEI